VKRLAMVVSLLVAVGVGFGSGWAVRGHPTTTPRRVSLPSVHRVRVPNLVGFTRWPAYERIKTAGLRLSTFYGVPRRGVPRGTIFAQQPAAGAMVTVGSTVHFTLSTGPPSSG
jgi:PASTA domain